MTAFDVFRHFRRERGPLVAVMALSFIGALCDAATVVFVVGLADAVSRGADRFDKQLGPLDLDVSTGMLAVFAAVTVLASVLTVLGANVLRARVTASWSRTQRRGLLRGFLSADWTLQSADRAGRMHSYLWYINASTNQMVNLTTAVRGLLGVIVLIGTALVVSPLASAAMIVLGGLLYVALRPLNRLVKRHSRQSATSTKEMNESFGELSELSREIRVFGVGDEFYDRISRPIDTLTDAEERVRMLSSAVTPIYQGMAFLVIVAALAGASRLGSVDVAVLGAVALLVLRSVAYGQQFQSSVAAIHAGIPAMDLLAELLEELEAAAVPVGTDELAAVQVVDLDHVSYRYPDGTPAIDDLTLHLAQGQIVGVVGPSGAGKSTLAQLLLRLRAPDDGTVAVNGRPLLEWSEASWASAVALVPQEPYLLHGTVLENIVFLRPWVTREAAVEAARAAGIHEVVAALEDGYDTEVGKSTRNLSGGQIQRIGIARALAGRPSLLVLDEPTSALDQHSEAVVQQTIEALRGRMLVVVIAHRLTTLSICDRIVVLNEGRLEAEGNIASVMEASPFFRSAVEQLALASGGSIDGLTMT